MARVAAYVPAIVVAMALTVLFALHLRIDGPTAAPMAVGGSAAQPMAALEKPPPPPPPPPPPRPPPRQPAPAQVAGQRPPPPVHRRKSCLPDADAEAGQGVVPLEDDEYDGPAEGMSADEIRKHARSHLDNYGNPPLNGERLYGRLEPRGALVPAAPTACGAHWDLIDGRWCRSCSSRAGGGVLDIAWAVSLMSEGQYIDGAAVLAKSIVDTHGRGSSEHRHHLLAFATRNVTGGASANLLRRLGYRVVEVESPVSVEEIRGDFLRERIGRNGCCGEVELIKLYSYVEDAYDRIVHLDTDSLVLGNMDELFRAEQSLLYTGDYGMAAGHPRRPPVQGGFLVVKPSLQVFADLVETVREGDYRASGGWAGSGIGRFYGGMTIQGLLPYYYYAKAPAAASRELDRCVYNIMVDNPRCKAVDFRHAKNAHFTVCGKPWACRGRSAQPNCRKMHERWTALRRAFEEDAGVPPSTQCARAGRQNYEAIQYPPHWHAAQGEYTGAGLYTEALLQARAAGAPRKALRGGGGREGAAD